VRNSMTGSKPLRRLQPRKLHPGTAVGVTLLLCLAGTSGARAQSYTALYSFQCPPNDGEGPYGSLIVDSAGNLYGTTYYGGAFGLGTVYELSASGTETVLHNFAGPPGDGAEPFAGLVRDSAGDLYGTTFYGGAFNAVDGGDGTVFEVSAGGTESVLFSFGQSTSNGIWPMSTLLHDGAGNLYGTASTDGPAGGGIVFKLSASGRESVLYAFAFGQGGENPSAGLIRDAAGNLYGTTFDGGTYGDGTVFQLAKAGQEIALHEFSGPPGDGAGSMSPLLPDAAGNLYGTTLYGGREVTCVSNAVGCGTVFKVAPDGTETVLLSFEGQSDGGLPNGNLVEDRKGNLYGIAAQGGSFSCSISGCGVVFELTAAGKERVLHTFTGAPTDGEAPYGGLLQVGQALYGTTTLGGANGCGTVFKVTP
jgi:uncharacterized repeat protein (TIGR03803 family)